LKSSVRTLDLDEMKIVPVEFAEPKPILNAYVSLKSPKDFNYNNNDFNLLPNPSFLGHYAFHKRKKMLKLKQDK
jgi:hypothetical protein